MSSDGQTTLEREVLLTGIGGQGVQLAAKVLAHAATLESREVLWLGTYGGTMRGGNTEATVVIGEGEIVSPPIVSKAWSALVVHPRYFAEYGAKIRPEGVVAVDVDLLDTPAERWVKEAAPAFGAQVNSEEPGTPSGLLAISATTLARKAEAPKAASLVLLGAFAAATGIVSHASLEAGIQASLPSYRIETLETNKRALAEGKAAVADWKGASLAHAWKGDRR